ncbi:MAG: YjbE family putative metal transport protein [Alphaproteobacteria bacterium]
MGLEHVGPELAALASVIIIDVVLAGDNALVVGLAASRLEARQRRQVIVLGIGVALVCRIVFAVIAAQLLLVTGLLFAGGLLLLWVAWKLWREVSSTFRGASEQEDSVLPGAAAATSFGAAVFQIAVADVSMSLDNVLGVAGAARDHVWMLVFGLILSITLMGVAAAYIARIMQRHAWVSYVGLLVVTYVAMSMIVRGAGEVMMAAGHA